MINDDLVLSLRNPLYRTYLFYCIILVNKMMAMSILTSVERRINKAFANPEDAAAERVKVKVSENVERVRRAHRNDLENIILFFVIGFIYVATNPDAGVATWLFRIYTIARILHTLVYAVVVIPPPARAICFGFGYFITGYMAVQSLLHFCQ